MLQALLRHNSSSALLHCHHAHGTWASCSVGTRSQHGAEQFQEGREGVDLPLRQALFQGSPLLPLSHLPGLPRLLDTQHIRRLTRAHALRSSHISHQRCRAQLGDLREVKRHLVMSGH